LTKDITKLIEAVNRVGVQNISLLSRMTGMPTETIRYTVKKRFPSLGLNVSLTMNQQVIGLERYFAILNFPDTFKASIPVIMRTLSKESFLTYWSKTALDGRCVALFSVPVSLVDEFDSFLKRLLAEGVLSQYELKKLEWTRHPELKSRYYNFSTGVWNVNWPKVGSAAEAPPAPVREDEPPSRPDVDAIDILIIKELELDSWRNIAEIARKLKINERTARWHYTKHVSLMADSNYVHWFPSSPLEVSKAVGMIYEFEGVTKEQLSKLRVLFNNFPFSWFEGGTKGGYYQVHLGMPAEEFMEVSRFLSSNLPRITERWNNYMLDIATERWYTIPYENFDEKKGWIFDQGQALRAILPEKALAKSEPGPS
jgi:hypothetical protein